MKVFSSSKLALAASAALIAVLVHGEAMANCPPKPAPGGPVCDKKDKKLKDEGDIQQLKQLEQVKDLKDTNKSEDEIMKTNGDQKPNGADRGWLSKVANDQASQNLMGSAMGAQSSAGQGATASQALDTFMKNNPAPAYGTPEYDSYQHKLSALQKDVVSEALPQAPNGEKVNTTTGESKTPDAAKSSAPKYTPPTRDTSQDAPAASSTTGQYVPNDPVTGQPGVVRSQAEIDAANAASKQEMVKQVTPLFQAALKDPDLRGAAIEAAKQNPDMMAAIDEIGAQRMNTPEGQAALLDRIAANPAMAESLLANPKTQEVVGSIIAKNPALAQAYGGAMMQNLGLSGIVNMVLGSGGAQMLQQMLPQLGSLVQGMMGGGGSGMGSIIPSIAGMAQSMMGKSSGGSGGYAGSTGGGYNTVIYTYGQQNTVPSSATATYNHALSTVQGLYYLPNGTTVSPQQVQAIQQIRSATATQANLDAYSLVQAYRQQQVLKPTIQQYVTNNALGSSTVRTDVQNNTLAAIQLHREQLDASALLTVMIEQLATQMMSQSAGMTLAR